MKVEKLFKEIICSDCKGSGFAGNGESYCNRCGGSGKCFKSVSPAELAGILKGDSWVLEEFKKKLRRHIYHYTNEEKISEKGLRAGLSIALEHIEGLESQVPVSELAKQAKEDRRKAEAWDRVGWYLTQDQIKEILAQSEEKK